MGPLSGRGAAARSQGATGGSMALALRWKVAVLGSVSDTIVVIAPSMRVDLVAWTCGHGQRAESGVQ